LDSFDVNVGRRGKNSTKRSESFVGDGTFVKTKEREGTGNPIGIPVGVNEVKMIDVNIIVQKKNDIIVRGGIEEDAQKSQQILFVMKSLL
jgi:hypothetical protein